MSFQGGPKTRQPSAPRPLGQGGPLGQSLGKVCLGQRGPSRGKRNYRDKAAPPHPVCMQHPHKHCAALLAHQYPRESPSGLTRHSIAPREDSQATLLRLGSQGSGLFEGCWNGEVGLLDSADVWKVLPEAHQTASSKDPPAEQLRLTRPPDQSLPLGSTHREDVAPHLSTPLSWALRGTA